MFKLFYFFYSFDIYYIQAVFQHYINFDFQLDIFFLSKLSCCWQKQQILNPYLPKCIITKLRILANHDKMQLHDKGHNFESYSFREMPLFNLNF